MSVFITIALAAFVIGLVLLIINTVGRSRLDKRSKTILLRQDRRNENSFLFFGKILIPPYLVMILAVFAIQFGNAYKNGYLTARPFNFLFKHTMVTGIDFIDRLLDRYIYEQYLLIGITVMFLLFLVCFGFFFGQLYRLRNFRLMRRRLQSGQRHSSGISGHPAG